jgi:hypothetical protein
MARSKSASRKSGSSNAAAGGFDFKSADVQLAVGVAAIAGLVFATQGDVHTKDAWFGFFKNEAKIPMFGFGTILTTLHVLNASQNSLAGHWGQSFFNAYLAAYGGQVLTGLINGGSFASTVFNEANMTLAFICWYLTNHEIPLVKFDLWGTIGDAGGAALGHVLDLASLIWTTNLVTGAVTAATAASGSNALFGFGVFGVVAAAHAAGCAGSYFPLNKGIQIDTSSAEAERATWTALFISSKMFAALPFVGQFVAQAVTAVNVLGFTASEIVMVVTLLQWLENNQNYVNFSPLTHVYDAFYKVTGL